jgi:hypothetical protein
MTVLLAWLTAMAPKSDVIENNQPSIKGGESFYTIDDGAACLAHSDGTKSLCDKIAVA